MNEFTPGPWEVNRWEHQFVDANKEPVANCNMAIWGREGSEANARLIAAAPEMLHELERLMDVICDEDQSIVWAVIAKARGETQ